MVMLLVEAGADAGAIDEDGNNSLHIATRAGSRRMVEALLLRKPANHHLLYRANCIGETPCSLDMANFKPVLRIPKNPMPTAEQLALPASRKCDPNQHWTRKLRFGIAFCSRSKASPQYSW